MPPGSGQACRQGQDPRQQGRPVERPPGPLRPIGVEAEPAGEPKIDEDDCPHRHQQQAVQGDEPIATDRPEPLRPRFAVPYGVRDPQVSRNPDKREAIAKWVGALVAVGLGSCVAACSTRVACRIPEPFSPSILLLPFFGALVGGVGVLAWYCLTPFLHPRASLFDRNEIRRDVREWKKAWPLTTVAYALGIPGATVLSALLASEMAYRSDLFFASAGGSTLLFFVYWNLARPLVPPGDSAIPRSSGTGKR